MSPRGAFRDLADFVVLAFAVLGFVGLIALAFSLLSCGPFSATVNAGAPPCPTEDASGTANPRICPPCREAGTP